jgi:hypothetical protein
MASTPDPPTRLPKIKAPDSKEKTKFVQVPPFGAIVTPPLKFQDEKLNLCLILSASIRLQLEKRVENWDDLHLVRGSNFNIVISLLYNGIRVTPTSEVGACIAKVLVEAEVWEFHELYDISSPI